jgi:hypothetical protein
MRNNLLLLAVSLLLSWAGAELVLALLLAREDGTLPLVKFRTDVTGVELWAYDGRFQGVADFDLRGTVPFREITYFANEDFDPKLEGIDPARVPNAIEVRFGPFAIRERDHRTLTAGTELSLVIGDSFCFGQGVRERDRFANQLEAKLAEQAPAGAPGRALLSVCYCGGDVDNAARALREFAGSPGVRRILYAYTLNDPIPDEKLAARQRYLNDFMHLRPRGRHGELPERVRRPTPLLEWLARRSFERTLSAETIRWYHELHEGAVWEHTAATIRGMDADARERGLAFTLVILPLFHGFDGYPFRDLHEQVAAFARASGIQVVDVLEAFEGSDASGFWVHPKDFHPNDRAHARIAEFLHARIPWDAGRR